MPVAIGFWIIAVICAFSLVASLWSHQRVHKRGMDHGTNGVTAKHPFLANPVLIAYAVFPTLILIGIAIMLLWYY